MGNIIGIDLGTTFSAVARLDETGRPQIVTNAEGGNITPSVVEFLSETSFGVGKEAKKMIGKTKTIVPLGPNDEAKRHMGSTSKTYKFFNETFTPVDISALILKKIKEDVEAKHGDIDSAVVTVPAVDSVTPNLTASLALIALPTPVIFCVSVTLISPPPVIAIPAVEVIAISLVELITLPLILISSTCSIVSVPT